MSDWTDGSGGREAAAKTRRRARIVQAATELLDERGGGGFSVDQVAERAGVSRRTVFNYFASIDDLVVAVGAEMLGGLVETLRLPLAAASAEGAGAGGSAEGAGAAGSAEGAGAAGSGESGLSGDGAQDTRAAFADLAAALRSVDLVGPMIRLTRALGGIGPADPRVATTVQETLFQLTGRLVGELRARHPQADPLAVDLLVASMIGGVMVLYDYWADRSGLEDSPRSRQVWSDLLEALIRQTGAGHMADPAQPDGRRQAPSARAGIVPVAALGQAINQGTVLSSETKGPSPGSHID
ncbi:MAG: TetR/AcrR family transcriptional regulator [Bifidobacteriaceae bacterium]|nr:TetR/AcrR family transcriptional regulator [Bifidobacteriaceae bacterium]